MNMHYCRYENTFRAMCQLKEDIFYSEELSKSEKYYREKILELVKAWAENLPEDDD